MAADHGRRSVGFPDPPPAGLAARRIPLGVPQRDYIALFGILHRHLTPEEVERIAFELYDGEGGLDAFISHERIREIIREKLLEEADVTRVAGRLAKGCWPLAAPREATLTGSGAR